MFDGFEESEESQQGRNREPSPGGRAYAHRPAQAG